MRFRIYLLISLAAFLVAVTGSDIYAHISIGGLSSAQAIQAHLDWVGMTLVGLVILLMPFVGVAFVSAAANGRLRTRSAVTIFGISLLALLYFYFDGFQAAQQAMLDRKWTAAALSVGLLPFLIGIPTVVLAAAAAAMAMGFDRRPSA